MRTIKFRGKAAESGKWVYGFLADEDYINDVNSVDLSSIEVDKETVGQFTGLHDKNGKEIYEGDIAYMVLRDYVNTDDEVCEDCECTCVIVYNEYIGSYEARIIQGEGAVLNGVEYEDEFTFGLSCFLFPETNVIGNIHDNPELLKRR